MAASAEQTPITRPAVQSPVGPGRRREGFGFQLKSMTAAMYSTKNTKICPLICLCCAEKATNRIAADCSSLRKRSEADRVCLLRQSLPVGFRTRSRPDAACLSKYLGVVLTYRAASSFVRIASCDAPLLVI